MVQESGNRVESAAGPLAVTAAQRRLLEQWVRGRTSPQRLVLRSRIILLTADGRSRRDVARALNIPVSTVQRWCQRFATGGPDVLTHDAPGRGRKSGVTPEVLEAFRALRAPGSDGKSPSIRHVARLLRISTSVAYRLNLRARTRRNGEWPPFSPRS